MHPELEIMLAQSRHREALAASRRRAPWLRRSRRYAAAQHWEALTVRLATGADRAALERLAALEETTAPAEPVLLVGACTHPRYSRTMSEADEFGEPISWRVLAKHTPVYAQDGVAVGVVTRVMALAAEDIFDGLDIHTHDGERFVPAEKVAAIAERAVALSLSEEEIAALDPPQLGPAAMSVDDATLTEKHLFSLRNLAGDSWNRLNGRR